MRELPYAEHNVVATFADMPQARTAVSALENRGVDASRIALEGAHAAHAEHDPDTAPRDQALLEKGRNTVVGGIVIGGLIGGLIGFIASGLLFGWPGGGSGSLAMAIGMTLGLGTAGAGVGLAVSAYGRVKQSEAWELTYEPESGPIKVGVHSPDAQDRDRALVVFDEHGAEAVEQFDRDGHRLTTP